ncbi:MAG: DUF4384 domain-containing protein [Gammaproteobacteria bacterium]
MSANRQCNPLIFAALALSLAGCAGVQPETANVIAQPKTPAVRNITSFGGALDCMDNLFVSHGVRDFVITSSGIPDATGEISTGTREMLISAISRMSVRSNAFRYLDFDPTQVDVQQLYQLTPNAQLTVPGYYIRGAISQLDQGVSDSNLGFGFSIGDADFSLNKNQVISVVTLDMNVAEFRTRQILPGLSANNSLAVVRTGRAADAGGRIKKAGVFFNIALDQAEGMHQAVRTLVELGAIELLGKLAQVPYWDCLQIESTNPAVRAEAADWYHGQDAKERTTFVQRALKGAGYYKGPVDGALNPELSDAIAAYQTENRLVPSGRIDAQLYTALLDIDKKLEGRPSVADGASARKARTEPPQPPPRKPVNLTVLTDRGATPTYSAAETLSMAIEVSSNAYVYCYYRDAQGLIARIYPNRFQADPYLPAGKTLQVPSQGVPFAIRFDHPGSQEEVACVASDRELSLQLPKELKKGDLEPLPVASIEGLIDTYQKIDSAGLAVKRIPITVR